MNNSCAHCYAQDVSLKVCSQCHKRKYCSKACQVKDWNKPGGQYHKFYCGKTGELGHCLEIKAAGEKGLGLFAKRDFKKYETVFVERRLLSLNEYRIDPNLLSKMQKSEQDAFTNLAPIDGSIMTKFEINGFGSIDLDIFINMSKVNHDCYGNTSYAHLKHRNVQILVAKKAIKTGEEITFSYEHLLYTTPVERRHRLRMKHKFTCHCKICSNPYLDSRATELSKAQHDFLIHLQDCCKDKYKFDLDHILNMGLELRSFYDEFEIQPSPYIFLFQMLGICCMIEKKKLKEGRKYIDLAVDKALEFTGSDKESDAVSEATTLQKVLKGQVSVPQHTLKEMLVQIVSSFLSA